MVLGRRQPIQATLGVQATVTPTVVVQPQPPAQQYQQTQDTEFVWWQQKQIVYQTPSLPSIVAVQQRLLVEETSPVWWSQRQTTYQYLNPLPVPQVQIPQAQEEMASVWWSKTLNYTQSVSVPVPFVQIPQTVEEQDYSYWTQRQASYQTFTVPPVQPRQIYQKESVDDVWWQQSIARVQFTAPVVTTTNPTPLPQQFYPTEAEQWWEQATPRSQFTVPVESTTAPFIPPQYYYTEPDSSVWWEQPRYLFLSPVTITPIIHEIVWSGITNLDTIWVGITNEVVTWTGGAGMIQYRVPIRLNVPQQFSYTFKDSDRNVIGLGDYSTVTLEIKVQGIIFDTKTATITHPSSGQVESETFIFETAGIWTAQFVCTDAGGNQLFGEPVQFRVVPNVEDMTLTQLLSY